MARTTSTRSAKTTISEIRKLEAKIEADNDVDFFDADTYNEFIRLVDSIIDDTTLPTPVRVLAMQIMEDTIGDGATITADDLNDYYSQRNG